MKPIERRLAYTGMKGNRRHTGSTMFIPILTFVLLQFTYQAGDTAEAFMQKQRQEIYGAWNGAVLNAGERDERFLREHLFIEEAGAVTVTGELISASSDMLSGNHVGYFDETAWELSHIEMIEGRLPEMDTEIAMEASTLALLGYTGTIGEHITLEIRPYRSIPVLNDKAAAVEYTLCGIIRDYQMDWSVCRYADFPTALLSPEGAAAVSGDGQVQLLIRAAKNSYAVLEDIQNSEASDSSVFYNEDAYPKEPVDPLTNLLQVLRYVITGVSAGILMLTVIFSVRSKESTWQYLHMLGCDDWQMSRIILWEGSFFMVGTLITGSVISALFHGGTRIVLPLFSEPGMVPVFSGRHFLYTVVQVSAVIFLTFSLAALGQRRVQRRGKKHSAGVKRRKSSGRAVTVRPVRRINAGTLLLRQWMRNPGRLVLRLVMITSLFLAMYGNLYLYSQKRQEISDFQFANPAAHTYVMDAGFSGDGLSEEFLMRLFTIYGIETIEAFRTSDQFTVDLSAYENTSYYQQVMADEAVSGGTEEVQPEQFPVGVISVRRWEDGMRFYEAAGSDELDRERFMAGEECLIVLPPYYVESWGATSRLGASMQETLDKRGTRVSNEELKAGDYIDVTFNNGEKRIGRKIKVAGVIERLPDEACYSPVPDNYGLITGADFMSAYDVNPVSMRYQHLNIRTTAMAEYLATDQHIAAALGRLKQGSYQDNQEILARMNNELYTGCSMYLCLSLLYAVLIILLLARMNESELEAEKRQSSILRALGRPAASIRRQYRLGALLPGVTGGVLGTLFLLVWCFIDYRSRDIDIRGAVISSLYQGPAFWYAHLLLSLVILVLLYVFSWTAVSREGGRR